jgi:cell division protein FtsB
MSFIKIINEKKLTLISISLLLYVGFNFFDGERGFISFYEKTKLKHELILEKNKLVEKLDLAKKKNDLLTNDPDLDYLEILNREKFSVGKVNEIIYIYEKK